MHSVELVFLAIEHVRMDHIAAGTVRVVAKPTDLAFDARISIDDRVAQRLAFDEVLRELIERPVEIGVEHGIGLESSDEDFSIQPMVPVECKARAPANENPVCA